jgi:hypothetical protein
VLVGICWNAGLPWSNCPGAHPIRHAGRFSQQHTCRSQERTSNSMAAIKRTIPATHDQVLREARVLTALSLVAVLATLLAKSLYSIPYLRTRSRRPGMTPKPPISESLALRYKLGTSHAISATGTMKAIVVW